VPGGFAAQNPLLGYFALFLSSELFESQSNPVVFPVQSQKLLSSFLQEVMLFKVKRSFKRIKE
jgi:hypothetical protein